MSICLRAGINALVGSTLDTRASQATTSGLGSMVGKIQSGVVRAALRSARCWDHERAQKSILIPARAKVEATAG